MPVTLRDGGDGTLRLVTPLPGDRHLMITIRSPESGKLEMSVWGRHQGEQRFCLWGGPHLPDDFLTDVEAAIIRGGLAEIVDCCKDQEMGADFERRLACAASTVLDAAARGDVAEDAPPA